MYKKTHFYRRWVEAVYLTLAFLNRIYPFKKLAELHEPLNNHP